jgi:mercuric ion binding protein
MKIFKVIALAAMTSLTLVSCKNETEKKSQEVVTTTSEPEKLATASFTIEGMHCEVGCAGYLERKLTKLDGVKSAVIDFENKKAIVEFNTNVQTPEIIVQTVENAVDGKTYKVSNLKS